MHINRHKKTRAVRLVMRMRGVLKLLLNTPVFPTARRAQEASLCKSQMRFELFCGLFSWSYADLAAGTRRLGKSRSDLLVSMLTRKSKQSPPMPDARGGSVRTLGQGGIIASAALAADLLLTNTLLESSRREEMCSSSGMLRGSLLRLPLESAQQRPAGCTD